VQELTLLIILIQHQARLEFSELKIVFYLEFDEKRLLGLCLGLELICWREDYTWLYSLSTKKSIKKL